jgi:two-component system sensor histidine kinase DesK
MLTELCTNILRHSKADNCGIAFTVDASHWQVLVKDNGKAGALNFGNGLTGITERLAALQGELSYQLNPGCLICLRLPKTTAQG